MEKSCIPFSGKTAHIQTYFYRTTIENFGMAFQKNTLFRWLKFFSLILGNFLKKRGNKILLFFSFFGHFAQLQSQNRPKKSSKLAISSEDRVQKDFSGFIRCRDMTTLIFLPKIWLKSSQPIRFLEFWKLNISRTACPFELIFCMVIQNDEWNMIIICFYECDPSGVHFGHARFWPFLRVKWAQK